jgi:hypothetical protein
VWDQGVRGKTIAPQRADVSEQEISQPMAQKVLSDRMAISNRRTPPGIKEINQLRAVVLDDQEAILVEDHREQVQEPFRKEWCVFTGKWWLKIPPKRVRRFPVIFRSEFLRTRGCGFAQLRELLIDAFLVVLGGVGLAVSGCRVLHGVGSLLCLR